MTLAVVMMSMVMTGCSSSNFALVLDENTAEITAENSAVDDSAQAGGFPVAEGESVVIEPNLTKGKILVQFASLDGSDDEDADLEDLTVTDPVFEAEIEGSETVTFDPGAGEYMVVATVTEKADGTVSIHTASGEDASGSETGLANPWTDVNTAEAAAEGAGVGTFTLPSFDTELEGGEAGFLGYRYMDQLAEADGYVGAAELTIRKGVNDPDNSSGYDAADVSGDYTAYEHEWDADADGITMKCFGNEDGRTMKAIWSADDYSYSIMIRGQGDVRETYGLSSDDIVKLAAAIK